MMHLQSSTLHGEFAKLLNQVYMSKNLDRPSSHNQLPLIAQRSVDQFQLLWTQHLRTVLFPRHRSLLLFEPAPSITNQLWSTPTATNQPIPVMCKKLPLRLEYWQIVLTEFLESNTGSPAG